MKTRPPPRGLAVSLLIPASSPEATFYYNEVCNWGITTQTRQILTWKRVGFNSRADFSSVSLLLCWWGVGAGRKCVCVCVCVSMSVLSDLYRCMYERSASCVYLLWVSAHVKSYSVVEVMSGHFEIKGSRTVSPVIKLHVGPTFIHNSLQLDSPSCVSACVCECVSVCVWRGLWVTSH